MYKMYTNANVEKNMMLPQTTAKKIGIGGICSSIVIAITIIILVLSQKNLRDTSDIIILNCKAETIIKRGQNNEFKFWCTKLSNEPQFQNIIDKSLEKNKSQTEKMMTAKEEIAEKIPLLKDIPINITILEKINKFNDSQI